MGFRSLFKKIFINKTKKINSGQWSVGDRAAQLARPI
jgi:hypothetical protein